MEFQDRPRSWMEVEQPGSTDSEASRNHLAFWDSEGITHGSCHCLCVYLPAMIEHLQCTGLAWALEVLQWMRLTLCF